MESKQNRIISYFVNLVKIFCYNFYMNEQKKYIILLCIVSIALIGLIIKIDNFERNGFNNHFTRINTEARAWATRHNTTISACTLYDEFYYCRTADNHVLHYPSKSNSDPRLISVSNIE